MKEYLLKIKELSAKIDILINNAGVTKDNIIIRMSEDEWQDVINTNLTGCFNCCKSIIKHMIKQRNGRIINISSIIGITGNAGQVNYSASKAGIIALTKSLSKEVGSRNINWISIWYNFAFEQNPDSELQIIMASHNGFGLSDFFDS